MRTFHISVTPLIISKEKENEPFEHACLFANDLAERMVKGVDYKVDSKFQSVSFLRDLREVDPEFWKSRNSKFKGITFKRDRSSYEFSTFF